MSKYPSASLFVMIVALAIVMTGRSTVSYAQNDQASPKQDDVIDFIKGYDIAWNQKNVAAVGRVLAPEYLYFNSKGRTITRQQALDFLGSSTYLLQSAERTELDVHRTVNVAVVSSRWKGHGSYDGKNFRDDQRCSLVLTQTGSTWQLLSEHCTQIVAP